MRVFVTGATGGIGSVVVSELLSADHEVVGLARSDASAERLAARGVDVVRGSIEDAAALRAGAEQSDAVIHLAFGHDFSNFQGSVEQEGFAVRTFGDALRGTGKALVIASGTPALPGRVSTEMDPTPVEGAAGGRGRNAQYVLDLAADGVRSGVVRLPRSVHMAGLRYGFASILIDAARRSGVSAYVGDGLQRWPAVHHLDAARLFRLVLEGGTAGTVAHAVGDEGDTMLSIAETIGGVLGLPVAAAAPEQFGFLGAIFSVDQPASSAFTQARFDWKPTHPSLLEDLAAGGYPD